VFFTTRSSQSTPVTLEQRSRHSAGSTRKNLAIATACSLSISSECCCDWLPFCTISIFPPGTAVSILDLICSRDAKGIVKGGKCNLLKLCRHTKQFIKQRYCIISAMANDRMAVLFTITQVTKIAIDQTEYAPCLVS